MTLDRLPIGGYAKITKVGGEGALRLRFLDMGLIPRTEVMVYKIAPLGDPMEIHLRGYSLTIRKEDAANIEIDTEYRSEKASEKTGADNAEIAKAGSSLKKRKKNKEKAGDRV